MPAGAQPTCRCGTCVKCRRRDYQREYKRRYRAEGRISEKDRARARASASRWARENPERHNEQTRRYRERHPEKVAARTALNHAIERDEVTRQPCEVCGAEPAHAHHDDYSKPLEVRWLCPRHHAEYHATERAAA